MCKDHFQLQRVIKILLGLASYITGFDPMPSQIKLTRFSLATWDWLIRGTN